MSETPAIPSRHLAVLTCMDTRIDPLRALGLELGEAHVLRNAGAIAGDDALRSLVLSQRLLQTTAVAIIGHTDCGLGKFEDQDLALALERETGVPPPFDFGAFRDLEEHVRRQVARVRACPWLPHVDNVKGYVLDVADGTTRSVD